MLFKLIKHGTLLSVQVPPEILRNVIHLVVVHGLYDIWVFPQSDSVTLKRVEELLPQIRLSLEHGRVEIEVFLDELDYVDFARLIQKFLSEMLGANIGAIEFFECKAFLDTIIFEHLTLSLNVDLYKHILEGIVTFVDSGFLETDSIRTVLYSFSLFLAILVYITNRVV